MYQWKYYCTNLKMSWCLPVFIYQPYAFLISLFTCQEWYKTVKHMPFCLMGGGVNQCCYSMRFKPLSGESQISSSQPTFWGVPSQPVGCCCFLIGCMPQGRKLAAKFTYWCGCMWQRELAHGCEDGFSVNVTWHLKTKPASLSWMLLCPQVFLLAASSTFGLFFFKTNKQKKNR